MSNLFGIPTYQIDRGVLENHLHEKAISNGVSVLDGVSTSNLKINSMQHQIEVSSSNESKMLNSRWFVDAAGRRSLVKK